MVAFVLQMQEVNLTRAGKAVVSRRYENSNIFYALTFLVSNDIMFTI